MSAEPRDIEGEIGEIATLSFEPWVKGGCDWEPPAQSEWPLEGWKLFLAVTHAFKTLHMTRDEIATEWSDMPADTVGPMLKLYDNAELNLKIMLTVVEGARARLMVVAAAMPEGGAS